MNPGPAGRATAEAAAAGAGAAGGPRLATTHVVVMGVSGCGKSSVGRALAARLSWSYLEGDELHPARHRALMAAGIPLTDEDRWPWLEAIRAWTAAQARHGLDTVATCSALRRAYRDLLRDVPGRTFFVHLTGARERIVERMAHRRGHFATESLLPSQLATLQPLGAGEHGVVLDIERPLAEIVEQAAAAVQGSVPGGSPGRPGPGGATPGPGTASPGHGVTRRVD